LVAAKPCAYDQFLAVGLVVQLEINMKKLTVRFSLMASLGLFAIMLAVGAALGVVTLQRANHGLSLVQQLGMETQAINDVYKDTTRTRSAMIRAYAVPPRACWRRSTTPSPRCVPTTLRRTPPSTPNA
jgi:hypothetical protein